jgi:ring-1,2-phenylacetyl-CoA epoxidase subunit PaaE
VDGFHPLRVSAVERLTDDAVAVTFDVTAELRDVFTWAAGQHLTVRTAHDERRTYSICAAVGGPLRIGVKRLDGGLVSTWLCKDVQAGDVVEVMPPAGSFSPVVRPGRFGLVGAGSGITPLISIAATVLAVGAEVLLLYGNRTTKDVMFLDELADLKDRYPSRFQVVHVLSREEQESPLLSGRLDAPRLTALIEAFAGDIDSWYLCGPLDLVTTARQVLGDQNVHVELFHAGLPPPRVSRPDDHLGTTLTATLHGRTSVIATDRATPLLDAVLSARADAPFACRGGVCGTCRARLLEGEVEMTVNWALEQSEIDAGVVLTCQAHPITDEVRVAYL